MPTRGKKDPNGRALRGRRAHTTFASSVDPAAQIWSNYNVRSGVAGAETPEQPAVQNCLYDRFEALYKKSSIKPSLVIVPARFKSGTLYSEIPTANGDFTVTRATTATRVNASGLIEVVASGIPRLDYPLGGGCPALLVEPSGTNGILNSENTATNWSLGANLSSGYVDVIGVSGNNLTVAVSGSGLGASAGRLARANNNFALASGSTYTISFLIKKTGTHTIGGYYALLTGAAGGNLGGGFNVSGSFSSGVIYDTAGTTNRIRRIEQWGTDVFCCSETFTMTASGTLTSFFLAPVAGVTSSSNPTAGSQLGFAAPQIELGSVPTSFIPTTTASVTRNADVISVSGAVSGAIGQASGTIYAEFTNTLVASYVEGYMYRVFADANNEIWARKEGGTNTYSFRWRANSQNTTFLNVAVPNEVNKIAFGYKSGDTALFLNGSQVATTNTDVRAFSVNPTTIALGSTSSGQFFNDRIRAVALYTTRLTNEQLAFITQP